jgi:hypothetical protein
MLQRERGQVEALTLALFRPTFGKYPERGIFLEYNL